MLELKKISKIYELGSKKAGNYQIVHALKQVSVNFRKSEFVSILGQSGCGKTTLLNIIGGLDKYTSGDLVIDDKSTKKYIDKDWDDYRNHKIGFVFQSYNLIPHLNVFENVELALTLSGISKADRKEKVIATLKKVGLGDKIFARPNQLSGGQMQRVAIARALINDPEIILADEPTGALDSKTSVQIMEILKEISKEKLIIMVTHNPELAKEYSSRIIKLLDGEIIDDTKPYLTEDIKKQEAKQTVTKTKRAKMSFWTALSLSLKNLLTKKARTILVSFAGSIGIIGIALILALSSGFQTYVNKVQEDSLSSYPIVIEKQSADMSSMLTSFFTPTKTGTNHENDAVYSNETITGMFNSVANSMKPNDIDSFYSYLKENKSEIENNINDIQLTYNINFNVFNKNNEKISPTSTAFYDIILTYATSYFENLAKVNITQEGTEYTLTEIVDSTKLDLIYYYLPDKYTSFVNSTSTPRSVELSEDELVSVIDSMMFSDQTSPMSSAYGIGLFKQYPLDAFNEMLNNETLIKSQYELVAGEWNENANDVLLVLDSNNEIDDYVLYALGLISYEEMAESIDKMVKEQDSTLTIDYNEIINSSTLTYKVLLDSDYYSTESPTKQTNEYNNEEILNLLNANISTNLSISGIIRPLATATNACLKTGIAYSKALTDSLITKYNNSPAVQDTQRGLTAINLDKPKTISIYVKDFESKNVVANFIETYNLNLTEDEKGKEITYNNTVDIIMSSVSTIINAISYVLIAFVSVSLIVSSIMIGIITYISVLERIKEIGVLRSIGASKRDIKNVFTAESIIIGFSAGAFGIIITLILTIPINIIINALAGLGTIAILPVLGAVILILLSMFLTFIAGLIPAKIASKKDPVIALRTE